MALEEDGYASVLMVLIAPGGRGLQTTVHYKRQKRALYNIFVHSYYTSLHFFFTALPLLETAVRMEDIELSSQAHDREGRPLPRYDWALDSWRAVAVSRTSR